METIGRYELHSLLGEGAMARVYRGFDPAVQRALAIKVLRPEPARDEDLRQRFVREAKAAGNLSHPSIVTIYDVGETDAHSFLTMELLEGESLEAELAREPKMAVADVLRLGIELADALDYAHAHGVVHRDIKPGNIVRRAEAGGIAITDFGIAHMQDVEASERTRVGTVLGTPHYMSPEQVMARPVDGRSDLFSVGVCLYQALAGVRPFRGDSQTSLFLAIANEEPTPLSRLRADAPGPLVQAVEKLLRKDPARRFQSGAELRLVLERLARELERDAGRDLDKARFRWPAIMVAAVAATMLLGTFLVRSHQSTIMTQLAHEYGVSLVEFVAAEAAEPMLFEDWTRLDVFVNEAANRQMFESLTLTDHVGTVRASTERALVGAPFQAPAAGRRTETTRQFGRTRVVERSIASGGRLFDFDAPVVFGTQELGRIYLSMPRTPIDDALRVSTLSLVLLTVVAIVAAGVTAALLGVRVSNALRRIRGALFDLRSGQYDFRIETRRRDEFDPVYASINQLAEKLESQPRDAPPPGLAPPPAAPRSLKDS